MNSQDTPTVFIVDDDNAAAVGLEPSRFHPLKEIFRAFTKRGWLPVDLIAALIVAASLRAAAFCALVSLVSLVDPR